MPYLTHRQLSGLEKHKYATSGNTILDPIMQIYWNWVLNRFIPLWIAPNLLTLLGLLANGFSVILACFAFPTASSYYYDEKTGNSSSENVPYNWARMSLLNISICQFIYQTLDAIDGKQARRTNSSSPLGELFDHGMDSISCVFLAIAGLITINAGNEVVFYFLIYTGFLLTFYMYHWSTYIEGKLIFESFDVTECQLSCCSMLILSSIYGPEIWDTVLFTLPVQGFDYSISVNVRHIYYLTCIWYLTRTIVKMIMKMRQRDEKSGKLIKTVAGTSTKSPLSALVIILSLTSLIFYLDSEHVIYLVRGEYERFFKV